MSAEDFQKRLTGRLEELHRQGRHRARRRVQATSGTECRIGDNYCVNFATNDYLGLSHHPDVVRAFTDAAVQQVGAGASPLIAGRSEWHQRLESALAEFEQAETAVLFPSGYSANFGTLTSLAGSGDAIFSDRDNHASIIDGCRASGAKVYVYRHHELDRLEQAIGRRRREFQQVFLVTDAVFSMDGTLAPLRELCDIAERTDSVLIVDEAHGTGVFGDQGSGVCELLQVEGRVPVKIGTLSKAIGCLGGFTAGSNGLADWLWNSARSQFFSTALPPAVCAAAQESLLIIGADAERRRRLHQRCAWARERLLEYGLSTVTGGQGPIIPILMGDESLAVAVSSRLQEAGFLVPAIRPPTVPAGTSRLRMSICSEHSPDQIDAALREIRRILDNELL
jgi:8-amino-7-oxononanoate synthase